MQRFRPKQRVFSLLVAVLFVFGLAVQGAVASMAAAEMHVSVTMASMADDEPMGCPGEHAGKQIQCVVNCAAVVGILFEPISLALAVESTAQPIAYVASLSDRQTPPDPYPPRPSALI